MTITTVWQLDMKKVKQMISTALSLPEERVIDASEDVDVTEYTNFITVLATSQNEIGYQTTYDGEYETLNSINEVTLSVNAFGLDSYQVINKLVSSMKSTPIYQMQRKMRIGFLRSSQIRSLPTEISGDKEQCTQVDLIFSTNNIIKANVLCGESVQIKTEVN